MLQSIVWLLSFLTLFSFSSLVKAEISDDLVQDLTCDSVSEEVIHRSLNPEAFSNLRHIPVKNWGFSVGLYDIANCWSLSHAQRILFYFGQSQLQTDLAAQKIALNMIRHYVPKWSVAQNRMTYEKNKTFQQVTWNQNAFQNYWNGFQEKVGKEAVLRNFKNDTETYQNHRFHSLLKNAEFITGNRERSTKKNLETLALLKGNLSQNKLTLIVLRPALRAQHVVLLKNILTRPNGIIEFEAYDSNFPEKSQFVWFDPNTKHYYAPDIVAPLGVKNPEKPIGLFIVDEDDRGDMMKELVKAYQRKCQTTWATN